VPPTLSPSDAPVGTFPRLRDRVRPGIDLLFVGINPGIRSALTGHHFAGYSNRFWKLLHESRLVPERLTYLDDDRLPDFGYGITNLVSRATRGIDELTAGDFAAGRGVLERKIRRLRPHAVALVGVTLGKVLLGDLLIPRGVSARGGRNATQRERHPARSPAVGPREELLGGAPVFVLPNPSGRNANFSYAEMLAAFVAVRRWLREGSGNP
jgi:TDG/mug DNA glycosylase family protein